MSKFLIGVLKGGHEFPAYKPDTGFYRTCAERVHEYFKKNNFDPKDSFPGFWRMAIVFSVAFVSYLACSGEIVVSFPIQLLAAVMFGICQKS